MRAPTLHYTGSLSHLVGKNVRDQDGNLGKIVDIAESYDFRTTVYPLIVSLDIGGHMFRRSYTEDGYLSGLGDYYITLVP